MIWLALACTDPPVHVLETDSDPCAAPTVTYANFGEGFLLTNCSGCHAAGVTERYGAPEAVTFDTEDEARNFAERIYVTVLENATMPPGGGIHDDDLVLLERWLECL